MQIEQGSSPRKGQRGRKKAAVSFKHDKDSKNRVRLIPEIAAFYRFVAKFHLRREAYREIIFFMVGEAEERRLRRLITLKGAAPAVLPELAATA